jgi:prepilin peptidase CpaA
LHSFVTLLVNGAALALLGFAALQDMRERLIANRFSLLLLPLGLVHHAMGADSVAQWLSLTGVALTAAALLLIVGGLLWRLGGLGGGDVKLLVAAAFFVGADATLTLLVVTALAGGALALAYLFVPPVLPAPDVPVAGPAPSGAAGRRISVPYGVAIATGAAFTIVSSLPTVIG